MADDHDLFAEVPLPKPLSRVKQRLIRSAMEIEADDPDSILYQHTVLCQTGLPYRDPGNATQSWERRQGTVALKIQTLTVHDSETDQWVRLGLPYGPKPRLILAHLNAEALRTASPVIEIGATLTGFVRRLQNREPAGPDIKSFKTQLGRLAAAIVQLSDTRERHGYQVDAKVISAFDAWFGMDGEQRALWPSTVQLSVDYFQSLQAHAVPLDPRAVAALAHSALALDAYSWLAQRLHRVKPGKPSFISWPALHAQFGQGYERIRDFRRVFQQALRQVYEQYPSAKFDLDGCGMALHHSRPAIQARLFVIGKPE